MRAMDVLQPDTLEAALAAKAERPEAVPLCGGTPVIVELHLAPGRPRRVLALPRVAELAETSRESGNVRLGAAVTYTRVIEELGGVLPGLALASRTVGSPQIRNRGT